jgi:DnaJ-class molecular chaperone
MNPYEVLEIPKDASDKDIKDAYRQMAKIWHPDKNKSPQAEEKFKEINTAYNILIDPKLRQRFDQTGSVDTDVPTEVDINELFRGMGGFPGGMGDSGRAKNRAIRSQEGRLETMLLVQPMMPPTLSLIAPTSCKIVNTSPG